MSSNLKVNTILPSTGTTVAVSGIVSATSSVSIGSSCTATTFYGSGANLTNLPAQATIANNADNRIITGGSGVNLNAEANLTFDGSVLTNTGSTLIGNDIKSATDDFFLYSYKGGSDGQVRSGIQFDSTNQRMEFYTATNERMRIETNGDLKFNSGYGSAATAFGVRAWISFDAQGTNQTRGSGNATMTDYGTGDFGINFTTAMPDNGYVMVGNAGYNSGQVMIGLTGGGLNSPPTTSGFRFSVRANYSNSTLMDEEYIHLIVVR